MAIISSKHVVFLLLCLSYAASFNLSSDKYRYVVIKSPSTRCVSSPINNLQPSVLGTTDTDRRTTASSRPENIKLSCLQATSTSSTERNTAGGSKPKIKPTARYVAISALAKAIDGSFATRELEQSTHYQSLDPRDRAFARLLVATVERRLGQIDIILKNCISKYPPKKGKHSNIIQATLRVGVSQLVFLDTKPFAAIKETVQVLRIHKPKVPEPMLKFVNGVLRNLSRPPKEGEVMLGQKLLKERTSSQDNITPWLLTRFQNDWGDEKTKLICEEMIPSDDSLVNSRIDLSTIYSLSAINGNSDHKAKLQSLMIDLGDDCTLLPQGSIRIGSSLKGDVKLWPGYENGVWWVQDASSTLPAIVLTSALYDKHKDDISDLHVVDMCSAPGGKTSQLLSSGYRQVTASEANPRRSRRLSENLERLGMLDKCEVVVEEGQNWNPSDDVHGILVDVPCSATGTGSRRPDVLRRTDNLAELLSIQETLANHCADNILNVGGIMVYATCSILKEESEDQVHKLVERGNVETLPIQPHEVPGFEEAIDENGWLRVLPGVLEGILKSTDGFFVERLIRK